jgi:DNA-binding CsgD family transcriptional regulator
MLPTARLSINYPARIDNGTHSILGGSIMKLGKQVVSAEHAQNFDRILLHLFEFGQSLRGQAEGAVERFRQEVAQATQQQMWLTLHRPSPGKQSSQHCPFEQSTCYPAQFHDLIYGNLYIMHDPLHPAQSVIPFVTANFLAQLCGYILYGLEQDALVQCVSCRLDQQRPPESLTDREQNVLNLFCKGQSKVTIAELLTISPKTVDTHVQHLCEKLHVQHEYDLPLAAFYFSLFSPLEGISNPRIHR